MKTQQQTHTPTPWEVRKGTNGKWIIWDSYCRLIAALPPVSKEDDLRDGAPTNPETKKANAELIVRAVNSNEELILAAKAYLESDESSEPFRKVNLRKAIAKAEGK